MSYHYPSPLSCSLPSNYAILARRFSHPDEEEEEEESMNQEQFNQVNANPGDHTPRGNYGSTSLRRNSLPIHSARPPKVIPVPISSTEQTPLLPPVPRIDEECDKTEETQSGQFHIWWEELGVILRYTLPVFGTQVLEYSLVITSVIAIGHLSTTALAASTLGSMTASVTGFSIIQGLISALDTLLPSAWTSSTPSLVGLWAQRMTVVIAFTLIPILAIWHNAESLLLALRQEPEVAHLAGVYLKWISLGLPAYAFNSIARRYFQSQGLFTVPTRIIIIIAPINALLNYLLVWGPEPIRLGFIGAPLATALSFNAMALSSLMYGIFFVPRTAWSPISRRSFTNLALVVQLGLAGVGQVCSEWWAWEIVGLAASQLGAVSLATQSVLLVSASTTYQAPYALSVSSSVRLGNLLGQENAKRASIASNVTLCISLGIAAIFSTIFLVFRKSWAYLFNDDPLVVEMVASILPLVALFQVFDGLGGVTGGILRARGKQTTGALLNLSAYYVIGIPFGLWLTFNRDMGLRGLWIGLTIALIYGSTIAVILVLRTDWNREVRKVMARLEADKHAERPDIENRAE